MSKKRLIALVVIALLLTASATALGAYAYSTGAAQKAIDGYMEAGDTAFAAGDYVEALEQYGLVPAENKRFEEAQERIAQVEGAIAADIAKKIDSYFQSGDRALERGDYEAAMGYYSLVPSGSSRFPEAQVRITKVIRAQVDSYFKAGDRALAADDYEAAIGYYRLVPEDHFRYAEAQAKIAEAMEAQVDSYFKAGDRALAAGDFLGALDYYSMVPETDARYAEAQARKVQVAEKKLALVNGYIKEADALMDNGRFEEAAAALDKAENLYPEYDGIAAARVRLKVAKLVDSARRNYDEGRFGQALADMNTAITLDRTVESRYGVLLSNIRYEAATGRAVELLEALRAAGLPIEEYVILKAETDPEGLLGRPEGYIAKISFADERVPAPRARGDFRGGSIEIFLNQAGAEARKAQLEGMAEAGTQEAEYFYVKDSVLLRLSGLLTGEQAAAYEEVFLAFGG